MLIMMVDINSFYCLAMLALVNIMPDKRLHYLLSQFYYISRESDMRRFQTFGIQD